MLLLLHMYIRYNSYLLYMRKESCESEGMNHIFKSTLLVYNMFTQTFHFRYRPILMLSFQVLFPLHHSFIHSFFISPSLHTLSEAQTHYHQPHITTITAPLRINTTCLLLTHTLVLLLFFRLTAACFHTKTLRLTTKYTQVP